MTAIIDLGRFVASAEVASLPALEREIAGRHLSDALLALLCGLRTSEASHLKPLLAGAAWPEQAGLVSAAVRLTEVDDIHLPSCTTPSSVTTPVALACAALNMPANDDALASAIWAGNEVIARLGAAVGGASILYRGIWPTFLLAPVGAAAAAARMLGLDEIQSAHALSMALMLSSGNVGQFRENPSARWFLFATSVAQGIRAALAAREGFRGDVSLLDGNWFAQTRGIELDLSKVREVGTKSSIYSELSIKPFCSSKQCIAAVEALRAVMDEGISPEDMARVVVNVPTAYANMIRTKAQSDARISTLVSAAHQLALAAFNPPGLYDVDRAGIIDDPKILAFSKKVEVREDAALTKLYPKHWPARVEVDARGRAHSAEIIFAKGDPENRLTQQDLVRKAEGILGAYREPSLIERWNAISARPTTGALADLYRAELAEWAAA